MMAHASSFSMILRVIYAIKDVLNQVRFKLMTQHMVICACSWTTLASIQLHEITGLVQMEQGLPVSGKLGYSRHLTNTEIKMED